MSRLTRFLRAIGFFLKRNFSLFFLAALLGSRGKKKERTGFPHFPHKENHKEKEKFPRQRLAFFFCLSVVEGFFLDVSGSQQVNE